MQQKKGYWVIQCQEITDQLAMQKYAEAWKEIAKEFDAKFIAGTKTEVVEGPEVTRVLILEFPSFQIAQDCYHSEKYTQAKILALQAMQRSFTIVEGI
ncbi:DUF1330 domain-containing protein [Acinetobacter vivianii]|uniref:DUF1330 domain-containing protein n=1 Tax=Acinetobacter vivianii TaxID=1776742 RepID=UPI003D00D7C9